MALPAPMGVTPFLAHLLFISCHRKVLPMPSEPDDQLIYAAHAPADLPARYRDLLDPTQSLPGEVRYIPRCYLSNIVPLAFLAIPAVFAVTMTVIDGYHGKLILKEWLALFLIFTLPFAWCLWRQRREKRLEAAVVAGHLRLGLILAPDALLLRMSPHDCALIPRQWITRFELVLLTAGRASSPGGYGVVVIYRLQDDARTVARQVQFDCAELTGYFQKHDALLEQLRAWFAEGRAPATTSMRRPGPLTPNEIRDQRQAAWLAEEAQRVAHERAQIAPPRPATRSEPARHGDGSLKTRWELRGSQGIDYFCHLSPRGEVVAYEYMPGRPESEMGGSVSFAEFLAGEYQNMLRNQFGTAALEEMIAAVIHLQTHPHLLATIKDD